MKNTKNTQKTHQPADSQANKTTKPPRDTEQSNRSSLDQHAAAHLQVQCMTEIGAVAPENARLVGNEGDRLGLLRIDDELDVVLGNGETMRQILDLVVVGQDDGH